MGSNSPLLCSGLNICHSGRTEVSKTSLHAVKQCVFLVLLPFSWDETSMWLDWNTLISTKLPVLKKYDNIRDLGIIATLVIKLLLSHALLARAAEVWRDKSCLRTPAVGGGLFFFYPEQARKEKKTELSKPEISAAGQIIAESLILINKRWYVKAMFCCRAVKSYSIPRVSQALWGFTVPSRWADEAAEWPASTDPLVRPWCSAGRRPSGRKRCSWQTSLSSAQSGSVKKSIGQLEQTSLLRSRQTHARGKVNLTVHKFVDWIRQSWITISHKVSPESTWFSWHVSVWVSFSWQTAANISSGLMIDCCKHRLSWIGLNPGNQRTLASPKQAEWVQQLHTHTHTHFMIITANHKNCCSPPLPELFTSLSSAQMHK